MCVAGWRGSDNSCSQAKLPATNYGKLDSTTLAFLIYNHSPLSQTWEIKIAVNKNCDLIRHKTPEWRQMEG